MKTLTTLATVLLISAKLFAAESQPADNYESYAQLNATDNVTEKFAAYTNKMCSDLKPGEGIRKVGLELNNKVDASVIYTESVTPVSIIGVVAVFRVGHEEFVHNISCYYEKIVSEFDKETNTFKIVSINPNVRIAFFNVNDETRYGSGAKEMYASIKTFKAENTTTFLLTDLPVHKKLTFDFDPTKYASYMDQYTSIFLYNNIYKFKPKFGLKDFYYVDATRTDDTMTGVYENITSTLFPLN